MARSNVGQNRAENFKNRLDGEDAENFLVSNVRVVVSIMYCTFSTRETTDFCFIFCPS